MRQNQINKRTAGKNNPVKDQTAGSFPPISAFLPCNFSLFYTFISEPFYGPPFPFPSLSPSFRQLYFHFPYLPHTPLLLIFSFFLISPPAPILYLPSISWPAISLISLIPLFPVQQPPPPHPLTPFLSSAELNGD